MANDDIRASERVGGEGLQAKEESKARVWYHKWWPRRLVGGGGDADGAAAVVGKDRARKSLHLLAANKVGQRELRVGEELADGVVLLHVDKAHDLTVVLRH